jgi:pyruvate,water dikinase
LKRAWIRPLDADGLTLAVAGGKGTNLARLIRGGFPVPGGFVVTTDAYCAYVEFNGLGAFSLEVVQDLPVDDPAAREAASQAIRSTFAAGKLPPELASALREAYAALDRPAVAVRSSATAEDLPGLSFAGQQDTYLNVVGEEALLEAVVDCWSSLWTARAIGYRARNAIPQDGLALAVVVQEMVQSEASGVLFTANPLDGKRTEMVIEATLGLGEALVSGQVEPDRYLVEAASGRIVSKTLGTKSVAIQSQAGGGTVRRERSLAEEATALQALPDASITELARAGRQVAGFLGSPQDVEWAWAAGKIYILQSRPITSLFPLPAGATPEPLQVMFSFGAVQGIQGPITPLGRDTIKAVFAGASRVFGLHLTAETQNAIKDAGERLWINITGLVRHRVFRHPARALLGIVAPATSQTLEPLWDDPRLAPGEGLTPGTLGRTVPVLAPGVGRLLLSLMRPDAERERFQRGAEAMVADIEARLARATALDERLELMEELLAQAFRFLVPQFVPRFGAGMAGLNMLNRLTASLPDGEHNALTMARGLPHNVTTEMDLALWDTAREIRSDPASLAHFQTTKAQALAGDCLTARLPETAQRTVAGFLQRYGMRGVGEIDLGRPRWREDPTAIMQSLQSYLQIEDAEQAPDAVFSRRAAAAKAAIDDLAEQLRRTKRGWLKARLVRWAARRMQALAGLREAPKFWAVQVMGMVRAALLQSGQGLVDAGRLEEADDLFFLHMGELKALARGEHRDWIALVCERREACNREARRQQIPRLLLSDGQAFYEGVTTPEAEGPGVLAGSAVSPGVMEGTVRVVFNPYDAQLAPGEILVCPGTDPAWTPLFLVAGGLVMEVGGLMTHGSVVAREYGIPAVVGVHEATVRLRTGQRVRVDGTAGRVTVLDQ